MFENIAKFFKKLVKSEQQETAHSKDTAKERLHLVLMQDRANVSADFLELMKQEIIEVIKKYIEVDDKAIDVRLTNKVEDDGTNGSPFLYANIPIVKIKNEAKAEESKKEESKPEEEKDSTKEKVKEKNKEEENKKEPENEKIEDKEKQEEMLQENKEDSTSTDEKNKKAEVEDKEENKEKTKVGSKKKNEKNEKKPEKKTK